MGDRTEEQILKELSIVQKMLEARTGEQEKMIRKFQLFLANDELFSQIIDFLPYPLAIFTQQYVVVMVNKAFTTETKTHFTSQEKGAVRILQYKIDDMRLSSAITQVFNGDNFFLEDIKNPFSMFTGIAQPNTQKLNRFNKAIIFFVPADEAEIIHGVIVFLP